MKFFREVLIGGYALRFYPSDNGWMCGVTNETMDAIEQACEEDDTVQLLPVDPTPAMKNAAIAVELFDHDTGKDYQLSWEEAEEIYYAMTGAFEGGEL